MKIPFDITFHPSWWYKNAGIHFDRRFFYDPEYRIEADIYMRKCLYERFGEFGLGEKDCRPRPIMDSDLVAGEYLQSVMLGCEVQFSTSISCVGIDSDTSDERVREFLHTVGG